MSYRCRTLLPHNAFIVYPQNILMRQTRSFALSVAHVSPGYTTILFSSKQAAIRWPALVQALFLLFCQLLLLSPSHREQLFQLLCTSCVTRMASKNSSKIISCCGVSSWFAHGAPSRIWSTSALARLSHN